MAGNVKNLVPRKKGENDAEFTKRVHRQIQQKKAQSRPVSYGKSRSELRAEKSSGFGGQKKYATSGIQVGNPFKGERIGRIRERVKA